MDAPGLTLIAILLAGGEAALVAYKPNPFTIACLVITGLCALWCILTSASK